MTSIVILPITVCEVENGGRWRVIVLVATEILRGRICVRREIKGAVMMLRLLKLVHNVIVGLRRVEIGGEESRVEVAVNATTSSLHTPKTTEGSCRTCTSTGGKKI